jgi:moderate conductance mechanosensitive channel
MEDIGSPIAIFISTNLVAILQILIISGLAILGIRLAKTLQKRAETGIIEKRIEPDQRARLKTLLRAGIGTLDVVIAGIAILMILIVLGIDIAPLLASIGVAGLALSLGAQTLIKDYIGGALILFENQFNVGEVIEVDQVIGTVERIELRATYVRDITGKLFIVPNGEIRILSNNSRDWSRALVDLNIAFDSDITRVVSALKLAVDKASQDAMLKPNLVETPQIQAWNSLSDWAVQVRIMAKTLPGKQADTAMLIRKYALESLHEAGIELAIPPSTSRVK